MTTPTDIPIPCWEVSFVRGTTANAHLKWGNGVILRAYKHRTTDAWRVDWSGSYRALTDARTAAGIAVAIRRRALAVAA
jgi:hypothetical protein